MKNVIHNFFYQVIFQLTRIILPVITLPIVARSLGPEGVGLYNYTSSIIQYFIMVSGLGFAIYGSREISIAKSKNEDISDKFWSIFYAEGSITIFMGLCFFILLPFLPHKTILLLQLTNLLYIFFDVSWFFMGIENFKVTSLANLIFQILGFVCILLFVNGQNDIYIYILIQSASLILPNLIIWPFLFKYVSFRKVKFKNIFLHLNGSLKYFLSQISNVILSNLNKTLLGLMTTTLLVGYFTNSLIINTVFVTMIKTMDTVMIPRLSSLFSTKNKNKLVHYFLLNIKIQLFFSIGIMFGMLSVVDKLVPWFFGAKFSFIINTIPFLSLLIVIMPLSATISNQYLLPQGRTKEYNNSMILAVILTILLDIILIPIFSIWGVIATNILVELTLLTIRIRVVLKDNVKLGILRYLGGYTLSGLLMMLITRGATSALNPSILTNIIQALLGCSIYMLITKLLRINIFDLLIKRQ